MRVAVYGLGNVLMLDDGFGPSAVRRLEAAWAFGEDVELVDLGTPGLDLPSKILDLDLLVFLDVVSAKDDPGTMCTFDKDALLEKAPAGRRQTTHEAGIREALWTADLMGRGPKSAVLIGVVFAAVRPVWPFPGAFHALGRKTRVAAGGLTARAAAGIEKENVVSS